MERYWSSFASTTFQYVLIESKDKTANMLSRAAILLTSVEDSLRATIEGLLHDAKSMPEIKVSENRSVYILKELKKAAEYKIMLLKHWKQDNVDTVEKFGEAGMSTSFMVIGRELTLKKEDGELQLMEEEYKKWKKEYQGEQKLDEDVEEKGSEEFDLEMMSTVNRMADLPLEDIAKLSAEELQKL